MQLQRQQGRKSEQIMKLRQQLADQEDVYKGKAASLQLQLKQSSDAEADALQEASRWQDSFNQSSTNLELAKQAGESSSLPG